MSDNYSRNIAILRERFALAADAAAAGDDSVALEPSRSGAPTGKAGDVWLHSRYDPAREAATFAGAQGIEPGMSVALYGIGLGTHLRPLLDAAGPKGVVVAAEANNSILRAAIKTIEDGGTLRDPRLVIVAAPDEASFLAAWSAAFGGLDPARTKVVIHTPSFQSIPVEYGKVANAVEMIRMERRFPLLMGGAEKENFRRNMPVFLNGGGIGALRGMIGGGAAAVVGAGPSLDRDIIYLAAQDRMTVLSSDTALPALLRAGVTPDIVFTADPQPATLAHFELAGRFDLPLALTPAACADVVERWEGPLYFGFQSPDRYPASAGEWARGMGVFESGGSVSCLALEAAIMMGASTVTLFGQDFGYPEGEAYARGTVPYLLRQTPDRSGKLTRETDHFGRVVMTSVSLYSYMRAFESMAQGAAAKIFTMSSMGARLAGVSPVPSPFPWIASAGAKRPVKPAGGGTKGAPPEVKEAFERWLSGA